MAKTKPAEIIKAMERRVRCEAFSAAAHLARAAAGEWEIASPSEALELLAQQFDALASLREMPRG